MTVEMEISHHEPDNGGLSGLVELQSRDHEEILNVVDQLRSEGISKYVNLPQLIVCGDQSSGKSSVLEAISGLSFPTKDNVCTRFATELILRRHSQSHVTASIYSDDNRSSAEQERLRNFKSPTLSLDRFREIVEKAEEAMGIRKDSLAFSKDILRVEVCGPTQPHLTLVDLPGLYHAPDESQDEEGVQFVESLVLSYMENRRSVMLAVISGKSDIALQKVTSFTRKLDPEGERTMGIITKPDQLPRDSEMEQSFYNLARNKRMPFRLGWHVLKNRTFEERHFSLAQRHKSETDFLSRGIWSSMPRSHVGIESLRPRLSTVLKDHILSQMPSFIAEAQSSLNDAEAGLRKLGESRETLIERRRYLLLGSERFTSVVTAAVDGVYSDTFFGDAMTDDGYSRRLRAVVQNRLADFSETMREEGEQRKIVADDKDIGEENTLITRSAFSKEVQKRLRQSRGRELPGTFNPLIVGDLFFVHTQPWKAIVDRNIELILSDVRKTLICALQEALDNSTADRLLKDIVNPRLVEIEDKLRMKVAELLVPHQSGHPITYNHYFVEAIQATRAQHLRDSVTEKLKVFFGDSYPEKPSHDSKFLFNMNALIKVLGSQHDTDMEQFACSEAIDCMLAYYKVARKKFVDDFGTLAIEKCLLEPLLTLYRPLTIVNLADDIIDEVAKEDESTEVERQRLRMKVAVLTRCLKSLHQLDLHGLAAELTTSQQPRSLEISSQMAIDDVIDPLPEVSEGVAVTLQNGEIVNFVGSEKPEEPIIEWIESIVHERPIASPAHRKSKKHAKAVLYEFQNS